VLGILFKFALDTEGFYASDEGAAKAAGHELKGLQVRKREETEKALRFLFAFDLFTFLLLGVL
jgi:hypothetical protein